MKIAFVLPNTLGNSGGIKVVFEYANEFNKNKINCEIIYPIIPTNYRLYKFRSLYSIIKFFGTIILNLLNYNYRKFNNKYKNVRIKKVISLNSLKKIYKEYDILYATAWDTYYYINKFPIDKRYIVQSYETWAGPENLVLDTYKNKEFKYYTITKFLDKKLNNGLENIVIYNPNNITNNYENIVIKNDNTYGVIFRRGKNKNFKSIINFLDENYSYKDKFVCLGRNIPSKYKKYFNKIYNGETEVEQFYKDIDCFIMPSLHEGFGLPILEAISYGNLLISTKTGILEDFSKEIKFFSLSEEKDIKLVIDYVDKLKLNEKKYIIESNFEFIKKYNEKNTLEKNIKKLYMRR
ncbi:glycosyltransferase [Clostridium thermobutyricum]